MKNIFILIFLALIANQLASCTKGGELESISGNTYTVSATLSGKNVFPAVATDTTSGTLVGWYDEQSNILTFAINYKKDTSFIKLDTLTNVKLYSTTPSASGSTTSRVIPFIIAISASGKTNLSGTITRGLSGNIGLSADEKNSFIAGNWYVILSSTKFPNGILGGQLKTTKN